MVSAAAPYRRIDEKEDPEAQIDSEESGKEEERSLNSTGGGGGGGGVPNSPSSPYKLSSALPIPSIGLPASSAWPQLSPGATTALIVVSWYCSNIGVLLLNKFLLSSYGFRYPVFLTLCHMCACCTMSYIAIDRFEVVPMQFISSPRQMLKIAMLSAIFCFSVVCGNMSLRYIPVSFNQAIGATTPAFTALFVVLITFRTEAATTYLTLVPVVLGIVIASNSEPSFHLLGVIMCFASTAARALKSVVQGLLLTSDSEKLHSMNLLLYMSPLAVVMLLPASLFIEGNVLAVVVAKARESPWILVYLVANAAFAYFTNLTNFLVTKHTSALTLQVLGNAKGVVAAIISVLVFRNVVTVMGMVGFGITICGVVLYSEAKKRAKH
ncbi:hypothetical protein CLOM_g16313 [Closterium sp. NIES-68]|nr:hypothetical protein CLOM_g16313 [Closterium sp. NIES-68]GJP76611.1 hypothetical protein CLOP_g7029 [Closterium sp. NIES-67]